MYAKIDCYKGDFDNNQYPLKNCEITLYKKVNGVLVKAIDMNGNECVGNTNSDGRCTFLVEDTNFDEGGTIEYWAEETKAPFGYKKLSGYLRVRPTPNQNDPIVASMGMIMFDKIIVIPPKTGGWNEVLLNPYTGNPIAEVWWLTKNGPSDYWDRIYWYYYDNSGKPTTEAGNYLPGHIYHPNPSASVLVTEVGLTWVDKNDNVTRSIPSGGNVPMQYADIFNL